MLTKRWITVEDFQIVARSHREFLDLTGLTAAEGGLLPEEFLSSIVEKYAGQPKWMGFFAIQEARIVGSGMFKDPPDDGWTILDAHWSDLRVRAGRVFPGPARAAALTG